MTTVDRAKAEASLKEERVRLVHQLGELGADEEGDLTGDVDYGDAFADAAAATAERTQTMGIVDALKHQLTDVDEAIAALESGTYGTCQTCGQEIGDDRLEFRPASILCVTCKNHA